MTGPSDGRSACRQLEPEHTLAEQCIEGEGVVQVNVELSISRGRRMINIIDVLKPSEEFLERQARGLQRRPSPPRLSGAELDTVLEQMDAVNGPPDGEETEDDVEVQAAEQGRDGGRH